MRFLSQKITCVSVKLRLLHLKKWKVVSSLMFQSYKIFEASICLRAFCLENPLIKFNGTVGISDHIIMTGSRSQKWHKLILCPFFIWPIVWLQFDHIIDELKRTCEKETEAIPRCLEFCPSFIWMSEATK